MINNAQVEFNTGWKKQEDEAKMRALQTAAQSGKFGLQAAKFANTILAGQTTSAASVAPSMTMPGQAISAFAMPGQGASTIASIVPVGTATPGLSSVGASTAAGLGAGASGVGMAASGTAIGSIAGSAAPIIGSAAILGSGGLGAGTAMGAGIATTGIGTAATAGMGAAPATKGALFAPVTMGLSLALAAVMIGLAIAARQGGAGGVGQSRKFQANGSSTETYLPKLYGKCRIGINRIFVDTDPDDKDRIYIIGALGIGSIKHFNKVYFDDEVVATWNNNKKTWSYKGKYKSNIYIEQRKGKANNTAYNTVVKKFTYWTNKCMGKNIVSIMFMLKYDTDLFPNGLPTITLKLTGSNDIYDPRTNSSGYTNNLALCAADYMQNKLAGIGIENNLMDYTSLAAEANYCDEIVGTDYVKNPKTRITVNAVDGRTPLTVGETRYYKVGFKSVNTTYDGRVSETIRRIILSTAIAKSATTVLGYMEITITLPTGSNIDQIDYVSLYASIDEGTNYYLVQEMEYDSKDDDLGATVIWVDNKASQELTDESLLSDDDTWTGDDVPSAPTLSASQVVFNSITTKLDYYGSTKKAYYRYKYVYTQGSNITTASPRSKAIKITKGQRIVELTDFPVSEDSTVDGIKVYRTPPMPTKKSDLDDSTTYPYKLCATLALNADYFLDSLPTASLTDSLPTINTAVSGQHARYTCDGIVDTSVDVLDNLESLLFCGRLLVYFQGGKYRFLIRKPSIAEDIAITDDNVIGDYRVVINGVDNTANIIRGEFFDNDANDQPNWVSYPPRKYKNLYLAEDNGFENVKEVTFNFVIDKDRAKRLCKVLRDEARFNLPVTVQTMEDLSSVKIGSVIKVTLESMGWNEKLFWVIGMGLNHNCTLQPILDQYVEEAYDEINLGQDLSIVDIADTDLQDPTEAPAEIEIDSNLIIEEMFQDNYTANWRIKVPFTNPESPYWDHSKIYLKRGDDAEFDYYQTIAKDNDGVFYIYPIEYFTTYYFQVLSVSTLNVSQPMYSEGIDDPDQNSTTIWKYTTTKAVPVWTNQGIELVGKNGNSNEAYGANFVFRWKPYAGVAGSQFSANDNSLGNTTTENFIYYVQIWHDYSSNVIINQINKSTDLAHSFYTKETLATYTFADNIENSKVLFEGILIEDSAGTISWNTKTYSVYTKVKNAQTYYDQYWGKAFSSIRVKVSVMDEFSQLSGTSEEVIFTNPRPLMLGSDRALIPLSILNTKSGAEVSFQHPDKEYDVTHFYLKYFRIGDWLANEAYLANDVILHGNTVYVCYQSGTSGATIPADIAAELGEDYIITDNTCKWAHGSSYITAIFALSQPDTTYQSKIKTLTRITISAEIQNNTEMIMSLVNVNSTDDDVANAYYTKEIKQLDPKYKYLIGVIPLDVFGKTEAVSNYAWGWAQPGLTDDDDENEIEAPSTPALDSLPLVDAAIDINDGSTLNRLMFKWYNNNTQYGETDIEYYQVQFVGIGKADLVYTDFPSDYEIQAGVKNIGGDNYYVTSKDEFPAEASGTATNQYLLNVETGYTYFARVKAYNTSGLESAWTAIAANTTLAIQGDIEGIVMDSVSPSTIDVAPLSEMLKIEVNITTPPSDLWGCKFAVKSSAFLGTASDSTGKADRALYKTAEIAAKEGKIIYYFAGDTGETYYVSAMPLDNSKNEAKLGGVVSWLDAGSGYQVTGITNASLGYSHKKFKFDGEIKSNTYNQVRWKNHSVDHPGDGYGTLKIKSNAVESYQISNVTYQTVTGSMILCWLSSATTQFSLVDYGDYFTDTAYESAIAIARVSANADTSQNATIVDYEGDNYSITSSMLSTNFLEAAHIQVGALNGQLIVGSTIRTGIGNNRVELTPDGIKAYDSYAVQRVNILADGSGWLGASDKLYWDTAGNLTVTGVVADSVAAENITAGVITGSTLQTAASGQRFVVDTTNKEASFYYDSGIIQKVCRIGFSEPSPDAVIIIKHFDSGRLPHRAIEIITESDSFPSLSVDNYGATAAIYGHTHAEGVGVHGSSDGGSGYGVRATGNATNAPLFIDGQGGAPALGSLGGIYVNSASNSLHFHNGTVWKIIAFV